jgi:tripartite-type tricarboxylate transporter receptor subunit TctC
MPRSRKTIRPKPVQIIEPFGAGGGPDLLARALAPKLSEMWGQPVTVDNHPGAGATAAPALVAKSPADGYTLLINTSAQGYSAAISKNLPYDPLKDFIPIASLTNQPYVLVAGKPAGVSTVRELIAAAKRKPGELKFGSTGAGTGTHLGIVKFNLAGSGRASPTCGCNRRRSRGHDRRAHYVHDGAHLYHPNPNPRRQTIPTRSNHSATIGFASEGTGNC